MDDMIFQKQDARSSKTATILNIPTLHLNSKRMNNLQSSINASTSSTRMDVPDEAPSSPPSTTAAAPAPAPAPAQEEEERDEPPHQQQQQQQQQQQPEQGLIISAGAVPITRRGTRHALPTRGLNSSPAPDHGPYARMMQFFAAASINNSKKGTNSRRTTSSTKRKRIIFPMKLMYVLEIGEYDDIVSWSTDGMAFVVKDPRAFTEKILQVLLQMSKFESFIRKLSRWGFAKRLSKEGTKNFQSAQDGDIFTTSTWLCHPSFRKGNFELCQERVICNSKVDIGACTAILDNVQDEHQSQKGATTHVSNDKDVSGMKSNTRTFSLGDASSDAVTVAAATGTGTMIPSSRTASMVEVAVTSGDTSHLLRTAYPYQNILSSTTSNLSSGVKRLPASSNTNISPLPGLPGEARTGVLQVDRMGMLNGALSFLNQANGNACARNTEYSDIATPQAISVSNARSTGLINTSTLLSHQNQQHQQHMNNLGIAVQDTPSRMTNPMQPYEQQQLRQLLQDEQQRQRDLQLRHELQLQLQDEQLLRPNLEHCYDDHLQIQEQLVSMAAATGIRDTNLLSLMISQQLQQQRQQGLLQHIAMPSLESTSLSRHQGLDHTRTRQIPLSTSSLIAASQQRHQREESLSLLDHGGYTVFGAGLPVQSGSRLPALQHFVDNMQSSGTTMGINPGAPAPIVDASNHLIHRQQQFQQQMSRQLAAIQGKLQEGREDERS